MSTRNQILAPLLVMLLLTTLLGCTAYQQVLSWENGVSGITNQLSELVITNNIHWGLRQLQTELQKHPESTAASWAELQHETEMLQQIPNSSASKVIPPETALLFATLSNPQPKPDQIDALINDNPPKLNLTVVSQLQDLERNAESVTRLVTFSMIALGLILAALTALDLDKLFQKLSRSRDLNVQIQEEERRRLAQELHDGVVQDLIDLKRNYSEAKTEQVIENLRRVCHNLKPQILEDLGLPAAIQFLADDLRQAGIAQVNVNLDETGLKLLPKTYELPLFRVIQELCTNLKRHAKASRVTLTLSYDPQESPMLSGYISDNGQGFDPKMVAVTSLGLTGIQERIQQMDGQLQIQSQPGQGAQFRWTIPIRKQTSHHAR